MQVDPTSVQITSTMLLGAVVVLLSWVVNRELKAQEKRNEQYDEHLAACGKKAIDHAKLEVKVEALEQRVIDVGDGIKQMDGKLDRLITGLLNRNLPS